MMEKREGKQLKKKYMLRPAIQRAAGVNSRAWNDGNDEEHTP